jgi:hypothetical protein
MPSASKIPLGFIPKQSVHTNTINHAEDAQMNANEQQRLFEQIASEHLFIETLEVRNSDRLDFHVVSVWGATAALRAAFEAGRQSTLKQS